MITTVLFHHFKLQYLKGIFKKSNSTEIIAILHQKITYCEKSSL